MNAPTPHWAVRDTLTGTTYRQPNKLIAEKVAAMHGASEVIQVPQPSADEHEEQARELQHLEVEQRLAATIAKVQRARTEVDGVVWTDECWRAQRDVVGRLLAEVSMRGVLTPPADDVREALAKMGRSFASIAKMAEWWHGAADRVLERLRTETTEDVMLYHDAVSVLVSARSVFNIARMHAEGTPPADDVREALDLDALEAGARAQIIAIDQMDEVGIGVGGMTRPNIAAYRAWQDASDGYDHADTVLALIERVRAAEVRPHGTVTDTEESTPVKLLRMFVREHAEGDGPEQVTVEVSDLRHVLRLLDAAGEARS